MLKIEGKPHVDLLIRQSLLIETFLYDILKFTAPELEELRDQYFDELATPASGMMRLAGVAFQGRQLTARV